jgi:predicted RNase H-like HicB family nuclease
MNYYIAVIEKEEDSCFGVSFPQLETVFSSGDSLEEATANAAEALQLFFEDAPNSAPKPWTMSKVKDLEDVREDIAHGAVLVAIPYIPLLGKTARANLTFEAGLLAAAKADAKAKGIGLSAWFASAAHTMLKGGHSANS